ncbi:TPR repeat-containing protein DDB_G0287407-like [Saccoglossus kowalevskii]
MENDGRFESGGNPTENVARRIGARSNGRIVRVYFSLPFRGMESEREELTQKQWPRLASICSKAGFEFVPVDLRCGITSEMFENAGTLDLSLREIDRSDIFVGFAGQQYSLHGEDKLLQKSFDSASTQYPWVNEYRNRSVTEIEFLHGHLRNPGDKPACFFFRDKEYDNKKVIEHETSESETEANNYKSVIDGQDSSSLLDDLKTRILESRDKCLKVVDSYSDPVDGAKRMFETVEKYLRETVLKTPAKDTTDHEKTSHLHNAYCNSRLGVGANKEYIGGDKYLEEVERHVLPDVEGYQNKPLLILGNPGSGKTSLLANWIHKHQKHYPEDIIAAHFVGCAPKSTSEQDVLIRLMTVLSLGFSEKSRLSKNDEMNNYYDSENSSTANNTYEKLRKMDIYKVVRELQDLLKKISESGMRAVIIIDALNKMESMHKTNQELYWLPTELPMGVSLLISSQNDTKSTKILLEDRQFDKLDVGPLDVEDRERIIKEILDVRGKRLEVEQTEKIINKPQTENPLFLKILLQDLCNFGSFEKLEEHLESLLSADSTKELFNNVLERMESSVDPSSTGRESILSKVMSCIAVSRYGLSEKEIKSIVNIPDHIWSRIYFTMEEFFIDRVGILAFAYDELLATVYDRYCDDEGTRVLYTRMVSSYFQGSLDGVGDTFNKDIKVVYRIVDELPWLLNKLKDNEQMKKCLTHLGLFMSMFSE